LNISGIAIGVPELWGKSPFPKGNKKRQKTLPKSASARAKQSPWPATAQRPPRPAKRTHQPPSSKLPFRSRVGRHEGDPLPRSRARHPSSGFALLEGPTPLEWISASLKGPTPLEWVSASLEAPTPLLKAFHPLLSTKASNAPSRHGCHGQRQDPRHAESLTLPGNLVPCGQARRCADIPDAMQYGRRYSTTLCHPPPSFFHAAPLEGVWQHPREAYGC
jgi:hypothetical protein